MTNTNILLVAKRQIGQLPGQSASGAGLNLDAHFLINKNYKRKYKNNISKPQGKQVNRIACHLKLKVVWHTFT